MCRTRKTSRKKERSHDAGHAASGARRLSRALKKRKNTTKRKEANEDEDDNINTRKGLPVGDFFRLRRALPLHNGRPPKTLLQTHLASSRHHS